MLMKHKLILLIALPLFALRASADSAVYVVTQNQQLGTQFFGTVDLGTGAFHQIGPESSEFQAGLVSGPNGVLLTLGASGLNTINPASGLITPVGPTGLGESQNSLGSLGGKLYATDLNHNLYTIDAATGAAHLIGSTGIPAVTFIPGTPNADGTISIFNESLFSVNGKLYATFDTDTFDPSVPVITPVIDAKLYQINPETGAAALVGPTTLLITASLELNGTAYSFVGDADAFSHVASLNLANGGTTPVSNVDPAAGLVFGASPVPEPGSIALTGIGIMATLLCLRRRRD
jgi:PEP-CTERM motif